MLIGIKNLWRIFPIKQKFNTLAAIWDIQQFQIIKINPGNLRPLCSLHIRRNYAQFCSAQKSVSVKKTLEVSNFCVIGKVLHNFLMPISIEPAPKSFVYTYSNVAQAQSVKWITSWQLSYSLDCIATNLQSKSSLKLGTPSINHLSYEENAGA